MKNSKVQYINVKGHLLDLTTPRVMGILNVTPDSFYQASRTETEGAIRQRTHEILAQGGEIIDVGAYSSRPNAKHITIQEEMDRLRKGLSIIFKEAPDAIVSVDTFRADVAKMCVEEYGVAMINDIAAGEMDPCMFKTMAQLNVPYIMMHMKGTPQNMQSNPTYVHFIKEVFEYFGKKVGELNSLGVKDIILDPGFGFGKTISHNYELMGHLNEFSIFELPILVGISRKSMIYNFLDTSAEKALNGTTILNTLALDRGANILRVHDVKEAVEAVKLVGKMKQETAI